MKNRFKPRAGIRIRKYQGSEFRASEPAGFVNDLCPEFLFNFQQSGLSRLNDLTGNQVSVNDRHTKPGKFIGDQGLSRGDSTSHRYHEWLTVW